MVATSIDKLAPRSVNWKASLLGAVAFYADLPDPPLIVVNRSGSGDGPYLPDWPNRVLSFHAIERELDRPTKGIGWQLGRDLADVDLDTAGAVAVAPYLLPETALIGGRTGKARSHYFFLAPWAKSAAYRAPEPAGMVAELRTGPRQQTAIAPSPHKAGGFYGWDSWSWPPARVDAGELAQAVAQVAVAGWLVEARQWSVAAAVDMVQRPDLAVLAQLERAADAPALRSWLGLVASQPGALGPGRDRASESASPYTLAIRERVDVPAIGVLFGRDLRPGRRLCPWHEDTDPSLVVGRGGQTFRCYACGARGDAIHAYRLFRGTSYRAARNELGERIGLPWQAVVGSPRGGGSNNPGPRTEVRTGVRTASRASRPKSLERNGRVGGGA
ncbi:MAG: CHC2 zinc finger domain-containing protein [Planctomycetota bacterium]